MPKPTHRIRADAPLRQLPRHIGNKPHRLQTAMHIERDHSAGERVREIVRRGRGRRGDYRRVRVRGVRLGHRHQCEEPNGGRGARVQGQEAECVWVQDRHEGGEECGEGGLAWGRGGGCGLGCHGLKVRERVIEGKEKGRVTGYFIWGHFHGRGPGSSS